MTSIAHYLANPENNIEDKEKQIPVYEHAGLHIVLKKIIAHDQILLKNKSEGKSNLYIIIKSICLLIIFFSNVFWNFVIHYYKGNSTTVGSV